MTTDFIAIVSVLVAGSGAVLVELWVRSRLADLQAEVASLRAILATFVASFAPRYTAELPTEPGAFWLRAPDGHESVREVLRDADGRLRVAYAAHIGFFADGGYKWEGPLPRPTSGDMPT